MPKLRRILLTSSAPLSAVGLAFVLSSLVLIISGNNPVEAYRDMIRHAGKLETQIQILNRATPLYLSGIAASIGFRMNLFNIGVEGQYILAFLVSAHVGSLFVLPPLLHVLLILLIAMAVGSALSGLAGVLKVARGVHEVISTIMLNAVTISGLVAWLVVQWQAGGGTRATGGRVGTEPIANSGLLPDLNTALEVFTREIGQGQRLNGTLLIAVGVGVIYYFLIDHTVFGFDLRASGINPTASHVGGVPPKRMIVIAMLISGAVAGLVGIPELMSTGYFPSNPVLNLGFTGIAVALLGRNHPVGVALGALLFAFLDKSSSILQFTNSATREIVVIMQGIIILSVVVAYEVISRIRQRQEATATQQTRQEATAT